MSGTGTDINIVAMVGLISSSLVGSGAIAFFVRYGTRLTLLEKAVETAQLASLHPRLSRVEDAIGDMKQMLPKLNSFDLVLTKLLTKVDAIALSVAGFVPRTEVDQRETRQEEKLHTLQRELDRMRDKDDHAK